MGRRASYLFLLALVVSAGACAQGIITTAAGSDYAFPGDGRPALEAPLAAPKALAFDSQGNYYIADSSLNMVFRVRRDGVLSIVAGNGLPQVSGDGGPARAASLAVPVGVAVDSSGNLFIAELFGGVRRVTPAGIITTLRAGRAYAVAVGSGGDLFVAVATRQVLRVTPSGTSSVFAGTGAQGNGGDGGPATNATLDQPLGLAVDAAGNVYLADTAGRRVRRVAPNGIISTFAGGGSTSAGEGVAATSVALAPGAVAVDSSSNVYIADSTPLGLEIPASNRVRRVTPGGIITTFAGTGLIGFSGDGGPAINATLSDPTAIAVDPVAGVLIADGSSRIRSVNASGVINTIAGRGPFLGDGGAATEARLTPPLALALDVNGNLLISSNIEQHSVRRVSAGGVITAAVGTGLSGATGDGGTATAATLESPVGLAVDGANNIYIADDVLHTVRRVSPSGVITTFAGAPASPGFAGDGGAASSARLADPTGVAADRAGNVYILDSSNNRIRRVNSSGVISTYAGNGNFGFSGDNGPALSASLGLVRFGHGGIAADAAGNIYFCDGVNLRVRRVDPAGVISTFAGNGQAGASGDGGPATAAAIGQPAGVAVDGAGNVYISAQGRIRRVGRDGIIRSYVNATGRAGFSGDGGPALNATLDSPAGLAADGQGALYIADTRNNRVRLVQAGPGPLLSLSQKGLTIVGLAGAPAPPEQDFTVVNSGRGTLNFAVLSRTLSGGPNWLTVTPSSGSSVAGQPGALIEVRATPGGLPPGDYYGQIEVRAPHVPNSPQFVTVILNVLAIGSNTGVTVRPSGVISSAQVGDTTPTTKNINISTLSAQPITFTSTTAFSGGRSWFSALPLSGSVSGTAPARIAINTSLSGFTAGVYPASLTLAFSDNSVRRVDLVLVLTDEPPPPPPEPPRPLPNPPPDSIPGPFPGPSPVRGADAPCVATRLLPIFTLLGTGFNVTANWPVPIEMSVVDDCARAMTSGTVRASFSNNDPPVSLRSLGDGRWSGTWQSRGSIAQVTIEARAETPAPALNGTVQITGGLRTNTNPPPEVGAGGVLNAASFSLDGALAPGSLISIFGTKLADRDGAAAALPLPSDLNGTLATIAGRTLPLLFASAGQINAMVPYDLNVDATHQLLVRRGTAISVPEPLSVVAGQGGVFTKDQSGRGPGIVVGVRSDGAQFLISPQTPVGAGDAVVIYCTGLGDVEPRQLAGTAAPLDLISNTAVPVTVTIGGRAAEVFFSGLTAGFTGLYQVNAFVPAGITQGDDVPLVLTQGTRTSPAVTIAVR